MATIGNSGDRIETARVLMANSGTRPEARSLLEAVVSDAQGTRYAREALDLLRQFDPSEPPDELHREIEALRTEWLEIQGPHDGRLLRFLERLHRQPAALAQLLDEVAGDLRRWLEQQIHAMERARTSGGRPDPPRLAAAVELVETLAGIQRFEVELRPEIQRFSDQRFGWRLRESEPEIRDALKDWSIERAWELMKDLGSPPAAFEHEVRALEKEIYAADKLRTEIQQTLDRLNEQEPRHWSQLRVVLEAIRQARLDGDRAGVPRSKQKELSSGVDRLVTAALHFLAQRAGQAKTTDALRTFWDKYQHLEPHRLDRRLEAPLQWFDAALAHLEQRLTGEVRATTTPDELEPLSRQLERELTSLPPLLNERCRPWVEQIDGLVRCWRAMRQGRPFSAPGDTELALPAMLPEVLESEVERYRRLLAEVVRGFEHLEGPGPQPQEALAVALEVLAQVPGHAEATRLRERAQSLNLRAELDAALERWDVETFFDLAQERSLGEPYRTLLDSPQPLLTLAGQTREPRLVTTHQAAEWWRTWQGARQQLASMRPAALEQALELQKKKRRAEWHDALQDLLAESLSPDVCRAAAESLSDALDELKLHGYHRELRRRETIGRGEQLLAEGRWKQAAERIGELKDDDPERRRLDTWCTVGQARAAGVAELAEELYRRWSDVTASFGPEAYELLEEALAEAWQKRQAEALQLLREVARRISHDDKAPAQVRARIEDWLAWLQIERQLAGDVTASGLRQLVRYLEKAPGAEARRTRCAALLERWRQAGETVALAWAYRALDDFQPPLFPGLADPLKRLIQRSEAAADEVLGALHGRTDLAAADLAAMQQRLRPLATAWRDLDDFLNLLSRIPDRQPAPERFREAGALLDNLSRTMQTLAELESCDLRQEKTRWNGTRVTLVHDLAELPVSRLLLARLERLEPLTLLNFVEEQIRKTVRRCASAEQDELDQPGLFAALAERIRELAGEFEKAERVGGAMWRLVSREYWQWLSAAAGDLAPPDTGQDLPALAARCAELEAEEQRFRRALDELKQEPAVGGDGFFDPPRHREYLALYPTEAPTSRRVFRLFDRFAQTRSQPVILRRSAGHLPAWIAEYLQEGVP